jgi:predicted DNA-binding transcriptional regulator AlpA
MPSVNSASDLRDHKPRYGRPKDVCKYFRISRSTLYLWLKTREGFPQPLKAGEKVTLFDIVAIEAFLKG